MQNRSSTLKQLHRFVRRNFLYFVSAVLLSAATGFFLGAEKIRATTKAHNPEAFNTDDMVRVTDVIDGDEVVIANDQGDRTVLRILGIQSFDPTLSDPSLSEYGKTAFNFLKSRATDQAARIAIAEKRTDGENRLLGTLFLQDEAGEYTVDLGNELVARGYSVVYIKYPFPKEVSYLETESKAREDLAGFWSNPTIVERIDGLKKTWQKERKP